MSHKRKCRRLPKRNQREKVQTSTGLNDRKRSAWEELFEGMTAEEIVHDLNEAWIDSRYKLIIINPKGNMTCDGQNIFQDWEVNHGETD